MKDQAAALQNSGFGDDTEPPKPDSGSGLASGKSLDFGIMQQVPEARLKPITGRRRVFIDALAMAIYLNLVYVWSLNIYPLGRDYAMMAHPPRIFAPMVAYFGQWIVPYHVVNLVLLYLCMLCLYAFTRLTVRNPAWLGTLAATLFMANPVHSEAVLNLCGIVDLLPCLLALACLAFYAAAARATNPLNKYSATITALALFALAVWPFSENAFLFFVLVLFERLVLDKKDRRWSRLVPFGMVFVAVTHNYFLIRNLFDLDMFWSLYLVFYPLGFLPETARLFYEVPWLGWVATVAVVAIIALIYRKARYPVILFGLFSMVALRFYQDDTYTLFDPVHMIGGGKLLLPCALFNVALVALFRRIMDRPKWVRPVVMFTTLFALALFVIEIRSVLAWRHATREVRCFQEEVQGRHVSVLPDYQYYRGAPMCLSESVEYKTPFSNPEDIMPMLRLNGENISENRFVLTGAHPNVLTVRIESPDPRALIGKLYALADLSWTEAFRGRPLVNEVDVVKIDADSMMFQIRNIYGYEWPPEMLVAQPELCEWTSVRLK